MIRARLGIDPAVITDDDEYFRLYAEALWLEEREMLIQANAIAKALGGK